MVVDCWDPLNKIDLPLVKHATLNGLTFTGSIPFAHILYAINAQAFETSEYPIILSIEDHTSLKVQKLMANEFKRIFGSKLIVDFLKKNETSLPSPEMLRNRVIIKVILKKRKDLFYLLFFSHDYFS